MTVSVYIWLPALRLDQGVVSSGGVQMHGSGKICGPTAKQVDNHNLGVTRCKQQNQSSNFLENYGRFQGEFVI